MLWFRLQQLRSLEWKVRSQAAEKLDESKDPRAVEALVEALKDKDRNVREAAAGSLGRIGDASAVDALLEALKDYDQCVRRAAADALGMIRDERVILPARVQLEVGINSRCLNSSEAVENLIRVNSWNSWRFYWPRIPRISR